MRRLQRAGLIGGVLLGMSGMAARAQTITTATLTGTVTDPSALALAGATVKVQGKDIVTTRSVTTDAHGSYNLAALPAGTYTLTVSQSGFATEILDNITLTLDRTVSLNVALKVGGVQEQIEVLGDVPLVDATTPATGLTITPEQIRTLPLSGRNYLDLLQIVPGVNINRAVDPGTDSAISILGERGNNTGYLIDGLNNTNQLTGGASAQFNQDTISEFEVITTGYKAEFGHASGGVVNVITRTGGNDLHGLASVFIRNDALDSSDRPGFAVPSLQRYDYDAALGGPLVKDKVFWFGSAERITDSRRSNFTAPAGTPAVVLANETAYDTPEINNETRFFAKLSEITGRHTIAEEANYTNLHIGNFNPLSRSTALPSTRTNQGIRALMIGATDTALLGNLDKPYVLGLYAQFRSEPSTFGPAHPLSGADTTFYGFSSFNQGGVTGDVAPSEFGASATLGTLLQKYGSAGASLTQTFKKHTLKYGYDYLRTQVDGVEQNIRTSQLFATLDDFTTYGPLNAGLILPLSTGGLTPAANNIQLRNNYSGAYVQDDWKPYAKLNISAGLRWDYDSAFKKKTNFGPRIGFSFAPDSHTSIHGSFGVFFDRFRIGLARDIPAFGGADLRIIQPLSYPRLFYGVPTIAPGLFGLCLSQTQTDAQLAAGASPGPACATSGPVYGVDHLNNVVAAGHAPIPANSVVTQGNIQQLSGLDATTYLNQAAASIGQPGGYLFFGPTGAVSYLVNPAGSFPVTLDPSFATPYTRSWNLGLQHQFTHDSVFSLDLYHKGIENILGVRQTNLPFDARVNGFQGTFVNGYGPWFSGKYNAAILSFDKRYSHHFSFGGSYAFTSENDDARGAQLGQGPGQIGGGYPTDSFRGVAPTVTDPKTGQTNASSFTASTGNFVPKAGVFYDGAKLDEGPSDFALRHVLQLHGMVQVPFQIQVTGIYRAQSGFRYTQQALNPIDQDGNGNLSGRDLLTGRNQFTAPLFSNQDLRVQRTFTIRERFKIEPIFEFFNLFNNANPAAVFTNANVPPIQNQQPSLIQPFGAISQRLEGRQGQAALRIEF